MDALLLSGSLQIRSDAPRNASSDEQATPSVRLAQADINQRVEVPSVEIGMKREIAMRGVPQRPSPYRVLRGLSRGRLRSVDRECAVMQGG